MQFFRKSYVRFVVFSLLSQLSLVFILYSVVMGAGQEHVRQASRPSEVEGGVGSCRFGAATIGDAQVSWLDDLGAGWYFGFTESLPPAPNAAEFVSLVSVSQDKTPDGQYLPTYTANPPMTEQSLGQLVVDRPGALWVVGNEVDRGPNPGQTTGGQGDTFPDIYAQAYHEIYNFIKARDPFAQIAISGLVQVTPNRLQYLDLVWDNYQSTYGADMPVDVWNMHLYVLPEVKPNGLPNGIANIALGTDAALGRMESGGNPALCPQDEIYCVAEHDDMNVFAEQVIAMRTWMKAHGEKEKPLILSEFSILYPYFDDNGSCGIKDEYGNCFTPQRVTNFLNNTFDYLYNAVDPNLGYSKDGNRLIQQSLWFSVNNNGVGEVSNLVSNNALTQHGQAFKSYVEGLPAEINLFQDGVNNPITNTNGSNTATARLSVDIRNSGNVAPGGNFAVSFYKDPGLTQPIGTVNVPGPGPVDTGMTGCSRKEMTVSVNWNNLPPGVHPFWVKIDSTNNVSETNESDNVGNGIVIVDGRKIFLPLTIN